MYVANSKILQSEVERILEGRCDSCDYYCTCSPSPLNHVRSAIQNIHKNTPVECRLLDAKYWFKVYGTLHSEDHEDLNVLKEKLAAMLDNNLDYDCSRSNRCEPTYDYLLWTPSPKLPWNDEEVEW